MPARPNQTPRLTRLVGLLVFLAAYGGLGLAYGLPTDWSAPDTLAQRLAWNGVLLRQVLPQLGVLLAAVIAWAAWRRRRGLALALLPALAVCWGPSAWQLRPRAAVEAPGPRLRVVSANLLWCNRAPDQLAAELVASQADVLVLQEVTSGWAARLDVALAAWPHRIVRARPDAFGLAVYSKRPLHAVEALALSAWALPQVRCEVEVQGRRVAVYGVHLAPPRTWRYARIQRRQVAALLARLEREPGPVVLAGDFNATERSPVADALAARGFVDALEARGSGRETTWPVLPSMAHLPSLRLDHVYLRGLTCAAARVGVGAGSDHRPVLVEGALQPE